MRVKFWGVRGSVPTPGPSTIRYGGNTPCVEVRCGDSLFILDAGTGIRELGRALMAGPQPVVAHLLIGHSHWDHVQGFPFFAPLYVSGSVLHLYGCGAADRTLEAVLAGQMAPPYFPVLLNEAGADIYYHELDMGEYEIEGVRLQTTFANHPGVGLLFRLEYEGQSVVYLSDNEPYAELATPEDDPAANRIDPRIIDFAWQADLLIADAAYSYEEYLDRRGWGHSSIDDAVRIALRSQTRRLVIFHHDPAHNDDDLDAMIGDAQALIEEEGFHLDLFGAREGLEIEL